VEGTFPETGATPSRRNARNTPRVMNYNVPYQWSHTAELDAYKDRGNPRPSRYLRAIHNEFYQLINKQVSQAADMNNGVKTPKVPEPKPYDGAAHAEKFERWSTILLHWFMLRNTLWSDVFPYAEVLACVMRALCLTHPFDACGQTSLLPLLLYFFV
jgi:hypothetical protein